MQEFVTYCESYFPDDIMNKELLEQRKAYNLMVASFTKETTSSLLISDQQLNGIATRRYQPKGQYSTTILYAHGGGWYFGDLDSHDNFCTAIADQCQVCIISVDYRLSPEFTFPAGLDDCYTVYQALIEQGITPLLMGDSAGGNLMAALTLRCRENQLTPALGQILIYPALAPASSLPSHQRLDDAPLLSLSSMQFYYDHYLPQCDKNTQLAAIYPLQATSFEALPPAAIFAAQFDLLIDDAQLYCQSLKDAGVPAKYIEIKGLVHGALHAIGRCDEANVLFSAICDQIQGFK